MDPKTTILPVAAQPRQATAATQPAATQPAATQPAETHQPAATDQPVTPSPARREKIVLQSNPVERMGFFEALWFNLKRKLGSKS